ncbi:hypothetical protein K458DRAFT_474478 [Lentithecium fluviatile CBS 122367]|uniref:Uncharacterized protein n=1 Tax=Lentithecium fluviatile CBS 122367 TaxID=1168545 RepID=A0A6G1JHZ6_9PLEO|nr:hypothetical protein K458DRAFT_474478 [Lentithecium fluviatile CBS 122367]
MATPNVTSDMAQFFDFGDAAMPEALPETSRPESRIGGHRVGCPASGQEGDDGCLCHAFDQDSTLPDLLQDETVPTEDFNTDFSSWLPRYQKPATPCDYCRSKSLECFIYNGGEGKSSGCSPCNALFRPCSFNSDDQVMTMRKSKTALDTLDSVAENSERLYGGLTGRKPMRSLGHTGPIEYEPTEDKPKKGAAAARFPRTAVKILRDWLVAHIDHPYPTDEEKESLKEQTGLTISQISNWMANTRRRQKARPKRSASPSIRPSTEAINIPPGRTWESLNPLERWKHSPPENEPAPLQAIVHNVEHFDFPEATSSTSSYRKENSNDSTGSFSIFRAPSTTSLETGLTNVSSGSMGSYNSAYSHSSRHSLGSFSSLKSKERRRRRRMPTRTSRLDSDEPRLFQCTFCTDRFKSKYDWSRHEKSLHLSLEKWICAPLGDVITCSASGQRKCVYCDELDPSKEHLETHNHRACEEKGRDSRTFYRKDHLRQHLRLMHGCKMIPSMDSWKAEAQLIKSRCGFCGVNFEKWQDRVDHLSKEFRAGATMKDWKGCRGLDPHVAALVTNAMPPYLIANETKSPFPFSATNSTSMKHHSLHFQRDDLEFLLPSDRTTGPTPPNQGSSISPTAAQNTTPQTGATSSTHSPNRNATCWEILTLRLGRYARQHIEQYGPDSVTDRMLQGEARRILYDVDDGWEQTAADNPEWLNLFKNAHGIKTAVPVQRVSHHDILEDLGLGPNAQLDSSFDLSNFDCVNNPPEDPATCALAYECSLAGTLAGSQAAHASAPFGIPGLTASSHTSGASSLPFECTGAGGLCIGEDGELGLATADGRFSRGRTPTADLACSKALDSFMTPITEMPCSTAGEPTLNSFGFPAWDQMGDGFNLPSTCAELSSSVPVSSGFDGMRWDDNELTFDLDLDLDLGMGEDQQT